MRSIRGKIAAIAIAAILISMLTIMSAYYTMFRTESDRQAAETMNLLARNTEQTLEKYIESIEQSVEMAANLAADTLDSVILVENNVAGPHADPAARTAEQAATADEYLAAHCAAIQEIFESVASRTHGVVTYYYCLSADVSENVHGFFYSKVGKTGFEEQPPLVARELDPEDTAHTTWYYTPIRRGRPSWVGPYTAHFLDEMMTYSYLVPIYKAGTLIGVLGMDIPFETLVEQIRDIRVYKTGFACLIDEDYRILYHPEMQIGSRPDDFGISGLDALLRQENNGDELIHYNAGGTERVMAFSTLSNGMTLLITAPSEEIYASRQQMSRVILIVTAVAIAISAALLLIVMGLITKPLQGLTTAARKLTAGDFDAELNYRGKDEVGQLTEAFIQMRDQQKQYIADLNHQIYTDKLTDLPNMRHFFHLAKEEKQRLLAEGRHPVMLWFDLMGMKHFNRQYGFEEGDRLICDFAEILKKHYGEKRLCRYSDDHFAAVSDEETVEKELQALFDECREARDGSMLPVRVGIYPNRLEDTDVSLSCDRAKYAADYGKGTYASGYTWFTSEMLRQGEDYRYIIANIDRALNEGWIKVYYQPIIRAADGKVCDEEALSRWIDPVKGFLSPAEFIPALEDAKLIYKLDLYVTEQVLAKMKRQAEVGLFVVPQSINLSRTDFDSCDIVEEIRRRVDDAGIERSMITIEITESVIGSDFDFIKEQVARFQKLGFQVWMDDFGSGYSSLDVLQSIRFDLIKFDMRFMHNFDKGDEAKIILTELAKMAISLGVETVCEGVEQAEQVEFLREIGCTKIQGYYYGKPISFEEMLSKYENGTDMGFENPEETGYYEAIGRINLYDMAVLAEEEEDEESLKRYFNTLPMAIMEVNGTRVKYNRCNQSYRDFLGRAFGMPFGTAERDVENMPEGPGMALMRAILRCSEDGNRVIIDERITDTTVHTFIRRVAVNPVSGSAAVAIAVLGVIKDKENAGMDYAHIAKALSANYTYLYYVNMETEEFVEYRPDPQREDLSLERHGGDFFAQSRKDALQALYKEDQKAFIEAFTKENMEQTLDTEGTYTLTYRLLINDVPTYVNMKGVRMRGDRKHVIIGVSNVDAQMRQQEALTRMKADLDKLTGVRNRTAYESMSETLTRQIEGGQPVMYAIVLCRVNGLAQVNEEKGREEGDKFIREACAVICQTFKHSPVFRVTGDQFAAIAQGHDYEHIDELMTEMEERERVSRENDGVIITCGMARYDGAESVAAVFQRAEANCKGAFRSPP
jgi:diguanylate cyclase (GGDEF)-like protein